MKRKNLIQRKSLRMSQLRSTLRLLTIKMTKKKTLMKRMKMLNLKKMTKKRMVLTMRKKILSLLVKIGKLFKNEFLSLWIKNLLKSSPKSSRRPIIYLKCKCPRRISPLKIILKLILYYKVCPPTWLRKKKKSTRLFKRTTGKRESKSGSNQPLTKSLTPRAGPRSLKLRINQFLHVCSRLCLLAKFQREQSPISCQHRSGLLDF